MNMSDAVNLWEKPQAKEVYMLAGWRQWADGGSISSGLPRYLWQETGARKIGEIANDGFYMFQVHGTHDLLRPVVRFEEGFPQALESSKNEFYYAGDEERGVVFFLGDEPHLDVERYVNNLLFAAEELNVRRIVGFGGVYAEVPYDRERMVSAIYSRPELKSEMENLAVNLSNYNGGASIGSYVCRRAGEREMEYVAFYAFVPTYDFSQVTNIGNTIRLENDFMAWLGVMKRVNYMLNLDFDLRDLEQKCEKLIDVVDTKVAEMDDLAPQLEVQDYMDRLSAEFEEVPFEPLSAVWEDEIRRLLDE
jgi:proteasome assembly chaperone (PAC2) family protein